MVSYYTNFSVRYIDNYPPDGILPVPDICSSGAEYATLLKNCFLEPKIPAGSLIFLNRSARLVHGFRYYIELKNGDGFYRTIRKSEKEGYIGLVCENTGYGEIEIEVGEIAAHFAIVGYLTYL